jgi:flagellar motor protein MotB
MKIKMKVIMIEKYFNITLLSLIFLLQACSEKKTYLTAMHNDVKAYTAGSYEINQIIQELSKKLDAPIKDSTFYQNDDRTLGEVTLLELPNSICIILNGKIFKRGEDKPNETATYIIEDIVSILKKYPHLVVQVVGHSDKTTESNNQDLSDNRAISIAEILYNLESRNETYAKGCSDKKPLFTTFQKGESISNARIEIYLYSNKGSMIDHCR